VRAAARVELQVVAPAHASPHGQSPCAEAIQDSTALVSVWCSEAYQYGTLLEARVRKAWVQ